MASEHRLTTATNDPRPVRQPCCLPRIQALIGSRRVAVQIDPKVFNRCGITRDPTFVLVMEGTGTAALRRSSRRSL
ncbi:hypothetical protein ENE75_16430 [Rubrivivax albus]|uniref:Uncharacterized protein n=1 Tax=Rubrivivax albus TaxID=2499835 RepID=A0A3S2TQ57_9BURK|nr:hypothetical protein ENE75_16430 [Rubrivivax albus]